jgi:hypothetical protein
VSCPEWSHLAAQRDAEPEAWTQALEHFDGCPRCRPQALRSDPLLVFRRLPVVELTPAEERSEVESMRHAVAAMRTAGRLESRRRFAGWRRWAAAAVLAVASLAMTRGRAPHPETAVPPPAVRSALALPAAQEPPAIEGLNRPGARIYHMDGEGLSVFMIVDESLDV